MYAMLCTRPDISFDVSVTSRYQSDPCNEHWTTMKHILKYLKGSKDKFQIYGEGELQVNGHTDSNFQGDLCRNEAGFSRYAYDVRRQLQYWARGP